MLFLVVQHTRSGHLFQIMKTSKSSCTAAASTADSTLPLALSLHRVQTGLADSENKLLAKQQQGKSVQQALFHRFVFHPEQLSPPQCLNHQFSHVSTCDAATHCGILCTTRAGRSGGSQGVPG